MRLVVINFILFCLAIFCMRCNNGLENSTDLAMPDRVSYNFHIRPLLSDKCFACHGPDANKRESGLRLDLEENAFAQLKDEPGKFAIVPGKPELSELIKRITSTDTAYQMPTPGSHLGLLTAREIALMKQWIKEGATYEKHWAFVAPKKEPLPPVENKEWCREPLDYFVLSAIQKKGLAANDEADPARLLKRLCIDITGLPAPETIAKQFFANPAANYEKTVDALLNDPHFGEKMAVHWCDVGRYADSYGYQDDNIRTQWPWRDWVIHAFNTNMPYNQFLQWQIAGDMMPAATKEQILATAFFRNHKYTEEGGVIDEEYRVEYLLDKVKTFSKGLMALTIECAQCHDHKYDPISQRNFYQVFAFFNNTKEVGYEGDVSVSKPAKNPLLSLSETDRASLFQYLNFKDTNTLTVSVMGELEKPRKTFLLQRGAYDQPGEEVLPGTPASIFDFDTTQWPRNRRGLANWAIDRNNPLTARVWVNRIWQEIFGRGLVRTSGDFGMQGSLPSHPELLDWLAVDFMENGWNTKRLIKQIVMSATYRQSAVTTENQLNTDPENIYLSRSPRIRMKAETVRDWVLATSGLLNPEIGGPSVKPYQPKGLWEAATSGRGVLATYKQDKGDKLYRRGLYTFIKLTVPPPSMIMFDASNRDQCEVQRSKTNTPLQALVMMNDPMVLEAARVMAQNLMVKGGTPDQMVGYAFQKIIGRAANSKELNILVKYRLDQLQQFETGKLSAEKTIETGNFPHENKLNKNTVAALMKTILTIYNLDEAITKT